MTTWETLQLDRQTTTPLTVMTDWTEYKKKKTDPSEVFCFLPALQKGQQKKIGKVNSNSSKKPLRLTELTLRKMK